MKKWKACCLGVVGLTVLSPGPLPVRGDDVPAAQQTPAPNPPTLFQKLGLSAGQRLTRRYRLCEKPLGQLLSNAAKPFSMLTGGLISGPCPATPSPQELAKPGAEGAAAQVKKDNAEAKARVAAVRFLGTVDCHYWPEAEAALISALRTDRNECVRLEAALALGNGCCCTKKTVEALAITVAASEKDKNPSETSERVRSAAEAALEHCLSCYERVETVPEAPPEKTKPVEKPVEKIEKPGEKTETPPAKLDKLPTLGEAQGPAIQLTAYYTEVDDKPLAQVVSDARRVVQHTQAAAPAPAATAMLPPGKGGLYEILESSLSPSSPRATTPVRNAMPPGAATGATLVPVPQYTVMPLMAVPETPSAGVPVTTGTVMVPQNDGTPTVVPQANGTWTTMPAPAPRTMPIAAPVGTTGVPVQGSTHGTPLSYGNGPRDLAPVQAAAAYSASTLVPSPNSAEVARVYPNLQEPAPAWPDSRPSRQSVSLIRPVAYTTTEVVAPPAAEPQVRAEAVAMELGPTPDWREPAVQMPSPAWPGSH